jgi:hypothetical protein
LASFVENRWAAPQARDHFPPHSPERIAAMKAEGHGMRNLNDEAATWRAPNVGDAGKSDSDVTNQVQLSVQARQWQGPMAGSPATDKYNEAGNSDFSRKTMELAEEMLTWAAPAAQNHKGTSEGSINRQDGKSRADLLHYQAEQFFRPPSSQDRPIAGGSMSSTDGPNSNQPSVKRKLNPIFVEALMRWPTGLSGFERQETAWTRWWLLMPSFLSALVSQKPAEQQGSLF